MPSKFAPQYIDTLLAELDCDDLAEGQIASIICCSSQFDQNSADYKLPRFAFLFVELGLWFAQACRSGVWTYFEATPPSRQDAMLAALREAGASEFSHWYARGMWSWEHQAAGAAIDNWMAANEEVAHVWSRALIRQNREPLLVLASS